MQATKQQQIMGFFIEEAKEHLDTIEQGMLNLEATLADSEQMNEVFRAAHSVKGGAAMLGFDSIHRTAHHLEDAFKILKDNPVKPDRQLENLFLKVFDVLKELVEALQSPFGFQEAQAEQIVQDAQPAFVEVEAYLHHLIQNRSNKAPTAIKVSAEAPAFINATLRKMLQLFKQGDTQVCRQQLSTLCDRMGQLSNCSAWRGLLEVAQGAIANSQSSYSMLAPLIIKEIKLSGDLLVAGRSSEIIPSGKLRQLAPTVVFSPVSGIAQSISSPAAAISFEQNGSNRTQQISIPLEPRAAARALLDAFNKQQLIELAEFLMKAIQ
ncbi:MAG: Hpt domain-containing protein [Leptolyngbyaceae cyanobacterium CAN_BIN12]|nr:Hpt domain-containing protein [Leptolyngbyaceae cyanobacterium CAN_BIN12]